MMRLVVLFLLFFSTAEVQDSTYIKTTDSINQINWKKMLPLGLGIAYDLCL